MVMSKTAALVEARRRWGRNGVVRYTKHALTAVEKEPLRPILIALRAERKPETATERSILTGKLLTYRCDVGEVTGFAFYVRGSGDTWEEAFANVDRFKQAKP